MAIPAWVEAWVQAQEDDLAYWPDGATALWGRVVSAEPVVLSGQAGYLLRDAGNRASFVVMSEAEVAMLLAMGEEEG